MTHLSDLIPSTPGLDSGRAEDFGATRLLRAWRRQGIARGQRPTESLRSEWKRLVSDISPRNSTNLGGGMIEGFRQVERHRSREYVNRVILLSDGLANQGVTDPRELNRIARNHRDETISLTTMGVGLDYN